MDEEQRALVELTEADREIAKVDDAFWREDALKRLDSLSSYVQSAWKSLMLVNGGAIVALFTFLGSSGAEVDKSWLWWAFGSFASGLAFTIGSTAAAYVCQSFYMHHSTFRAWNAREVVHGRQPPHDETTAAKVGGRWEILGLSLAGASLAAFILGSGFALAALN